VDAVVALDVRRRELLPTLESMRAERNQASQEIAQAKRAGEDTAAAIERMRALGERPTRFMLRVFNYLFRQQREVDAAQIHAMREMMTILYVVGRHLSNLTDRVADLEERLESERREP